ncbi:hypothetical protein Tco_0323673 [Tanacetum coccineum]
METHIQELFWMYLALTVQLSSCISHHADVPEIYMQPVLEFYSNNEGNKAYKTYIGYVTCEVPPKIARKFKKASPSKKDSDLVLVDEEPVRKGKRLKKHAKKSASKPTTGIVIKEPPVETKSKEKEKEKEKEKVDVAHGKGIELLSDVALTEEAQMKEVRKKSLRYFYRTHPSCSGMVAAKPLRVDTITPTVTSEGTGEKPRVPDVTEDDSTESKSESWGNDEDDSNNEQEPSNESSKHENESEEQESNSEQEEESNDNEQDEEELEETTQTAKGVVQGEGTDAEMTDAQQGNKNLETTQEQVVEDAHVTIFTVPKKTEVPVTSSSRSSDLASKFLIFLDIPHVDAEIVSLLDVHVHHEVPRSQAPTLLTVPVSVITESSPVFTSIPQSSQTFTPSPLHATPTPPPTNGTINPLSTLPDFSSVFRFNNRIIALEKEVADLKKDPLHTQVTTSFDEHLDTRLGKTEEEFMNFLSESLTTRIKEQVKDQLPQILPKEVSNFASPVIETLIRESRDDVNLERVSSQQQSTYEAASTLTEFELKKILIDKMEKSESYLAALEHRDCYYSLKKSYDLDKDLFVSYDVYSLKHGREDKDKDEEPSTGSDRGLKKRKTSKDTVQSEEPVFKVADSDMLQDQAGNQDDNEDEQRNKNASRREWFKKPTPTQESTDPDWHVGKILQEGQTYNWLMTPAALISRIWMGLWTH